MGSHGSDVIGKTVPEPHFDGIVVADVGQVNRQSTGGEMKTSVDRIRPAKTDALRSGKMMCHHRLDLSVVPVP